MKPLLFLIVGNLLHLLLTAPKAAAQISWQTLPLVFENTVRCMYVDSTDSTIYIGGNFNHLDSDFTGCVVKMRKDYSRIPLPPIQGGPCMTIIKWHGELYVGGYTFFWKYNGTSWDKLDSVGLTFCLYEYKGKLLIGGNFSEHGFGGDSTLKASIIEFDGSTFRIFKGVDSVVRENCFVYAMVEYDNELVIAGNIDPHPPIDPRFKEILKWTGSTWAPLGDGIRGGGLDEVGSLFVLNDGLYVAGYFRKDEGAPGNSIARWNTGSWDDMGGGVQGGVAGLSGRGDTLLVTGLFQEATGKYCQHFAAYTNSRWSVNTVPIDNLTISCVDFFGDLLVGGGFRIIGPDTCMSIARITSLGNQFQSMGVERKVSGSSLLSVTPNPGTGRFSISLESQQINAVVAVMVTTITGRQIFRKWYRITSRHFQQEIEISTAAKGIYFVEVIAGWERLTKTIVLQ